MKTIEIDKVSYQYNSGTNCTPALSNISITVEEGEFVVLLGGNGGGKSTLAKLINGLLIPTSGEVRVQGIPTSDESRKFDIRKNVGMVFQNPDNQMVATIVEDDVAFGPENIGVPPHEIEERIDWALQAVGMPEHRKSTPERMSGGQKQRIAIAGVLALKPRILVLDEATAMLDPKGRQEVMNVIRRLNREEGITVVHITHFMEEAIMADRIVVLSDGEIKMTGTPNEIFERRSELVKYKLSLPPVLAIADMLREGGMKVPFTSDINKFSDAITELCKGKAKIAFQPQKSNSKIEETSTINIKNLSYSYMPNTPYETKALYNVDLDIKKGELFGIIGHTGSGKSTLIQHLNGLIKTTSGEVSICGISLDEPKPDYRKIRSLVGMVFQYPEYQLFDETVARDVGFGPRNMKLSSAEIDERVRDAISLVGLNYDEVASRSPFELSGGQKRRVAIAGVIAMRPQILVLDEPTAGLDPVGKREILSLIGEMHAHTSDTVIMISHNMDEIADIADRIAVMKNGRIVAVGEPRKLFADATLVEECGIELPASIKLSILLSNSGIDTGEISVRKSELASKILKLYNGDAV